MDSKARTTQINALKELLRDDDPQIRVAVRNRFLALGDAGLEALREAAADPDPGYRLRARQALWFVESEGVFREFANLLAEEDFDLEAGVCAIARLERPSLTPEEVGSELDELASLVRPLVEAADGPRARARALAEVLGGHLGFQGDAGDYYGVRNSLVDHVLERRRGIPISLSAVYILVGRRCGLDVHGVGMPSHFLVAVEEPNARFLLDPFGGGRFLTSEGCRALLAQFNHSFRPDYLRSVGDRQLLRRMLANLVRIFLEREDHLRLSRLYYLVNILQDQEDRGHDER